MRCVPSTSSVWISAFRPAPSWASQMVTVQVEPEQAHLLLLAQQFGKISLMLRNPMVDKDKEVVADATTLREMLANLGITSTPGLPPATTNTVKPVHPDVDTLKKLDKALLDEYLKPPEDRDYASLLAKFQAFEPTKESGVRPHVIAQIESLKREIQRQKGAAASPETQYITVELWLGDKPPVLKRFQIPTCEDDTEPATQ